MMADEFQPKGELSMKLSKENKNILKSFFITIIIFYLIGIGYKFGAVFFDSISTKKYFYESVELVSFKDKSDNKVEIKFEDEMGRGYKVYAIEPYKKYLWVGNTYNIELENKNLVGLERKIIIKENN